MKRSKAVISGGLVTLATVGAALVALPTAQAGPSVGGPSSDEQPVHVDVLAPERGHNVGISGAGWIVDLDVDFEDATLSQTGFTGLQLTGPGVHNNVAPFPGAFSPGQDDRMPGLVVLDSTITAFSGPGTNLANLFNLTGVTDRSSTGTELWDTWIVGAPIAGQDVRSRLTVAVVDDLNHDGIYNDAPSTVTDLNGDGTINADDLEKLGVASNIATVRFHISGDPA